MVKEISSCDSKLSHEAIKVNEHNDDSRTSDNEGKTVANRDVKCELLRTGIE